jgi:hypothetical protein
MRYRRGAQKARPSTSSWHQRPCIKKSLYDVLELSHLLNVRAADYQIVDVDRDGAVVVCVQTQCWGLDDFDGIEHLFQAQMPAEWGLLQRIQCIVVLHDLGSESIGQNLGRTHIQYFCQRGTHERVRDVQAVHNTVPTGSDAEFETNDSEIGDGCVRLIEVDAMYLSISASNKTGLVLDDRTSRVSFRFQDQMLAQDIHIRLVWNHCPGSCVLQRANLYSAARTNVVLRIVMSTITVV